MAGLTEFYADGMSLVTPPNSNGWNIPLKGRCHEMDIFLKVLKMKTVCFV